MCLLDGVKRDRGVAAAISSSIKLSARMKGVVYDGISCQSGRGVQSCSYQLVNISRTWHPRTYSTKFRLCRPCRKLVQDAI